MLRDIIYSSKVTEVFKIAEDAKRGMLLVKGVSGATKATGEGVQVYVLDADNQPQGYLADLEISAYDPLLDTVKANTQGILSTYAVGASIAVDQVDGVFASGDYAIAKNGLFSPATTGQVSKFKYVGEYQDGDKTLQQFEVVDPHTVA